MSSCVQHDLVALESPAWWEGYEGVGSSLIGGPWGNRWGATIIRLPLYGTCPSLDATKRNSHKADGQFQKRGGSVKKMEVQRVEQMKGQFRLKKQSLEAVMLSPNGTQPSLMGDKVSTTYFANYDATNCTSILGINVHVNRSNCDDRTKIVFSSSPPYYLCRLLVLLQGGWIET